MTMLQMPRWMVTVTLAAVLFVVVTTGLNALPDAAFNSLPGWAQRCIVPGIEFRGGSRVVMEADRTALRREMLKELRTESVMVLRQARIALVRPPAVRDDHVEILVSGNDLERGLSAISGLAWPAPADADAATRGALRPLLPRYVGGSSVRADRHADRLGHFSSPDVRVDNLGDGRFRLTLTEEAVEQRIRTGLRRVIEIVDRRVEESGFARSEVQVVGGDRIAIEVRGLDLRRMPVH